VLINIQRQTIVSVWIKYVIIPNKVKLSLCLNEHHTIKTYRGMDV